MKTEISILIADDHKLLLQSLAAVLGEFSYVKSVETCSSYQQIQEQFKEGVPDVIFLDINLPPHDGLAICRELRDKYPDLYIIILTSYSEQGRINVAKQNGANAYFNKAVEIEALDLHLQNFIKGNAPAFAMEGFSHVEEERAHYYTNVLGNPQLTPREKQIAELLVLGKGHQDVTKSLNISYDTFKTHRTNILHKLGCKSVAELITSAYGYNKL